MSDWISARRGSRGVSESETIKLMLQEFILHFASEPALNKLSLSCVFAGSASSIFACHKESEQVTGANPFDESLVEEHVATIMGLFFAADAVKYN